MTNPFTEAGQAILAALLHNPAFSTEGNDARVRIGNRLVVWSNTPGARTVDKQVNRAPADSPEVLLTQNGFGMSPAGMNSKTANAEQTYTLQLLDTRATVERLNALKWETFLAILRATHGQRHPFGLTYVHDWRIDNATEGRPLDAENRPTGDWVAVLNIVLGMYWNKSDLL